jgi:hypothetical protein
VFPGSCQTSRMEGVMLPSYRRNAKKLQTE